MYVGPDCAKMAPDMLSLLINTLPAELEQAAAFCRAEGIGLEVAAFSDVAILDGDMDEQIRRHARALKGIKPVVSHGPFHDLFATSRDPAIRAVCTQRHRQSLKAAREIGAGMYVAHTNYNVLILSAGYRTSFVLRSLDFWMPLVHEAIRDGISIVLENLWEGDPGLQRELVEKAGHPNLKASFDNGHALVFSKIAATHWIETFGEGLGHVHLHDNDGKLDSHRPVGEGIEDWPRLISALRTHAPGALVVAECDSLEANRASLTAIRRHLARLSS